MAAAGSGSGSRRAQCAAYRNKLRPRHRSSNLETVESDFIAENRNKYRTDISTLFHDRDHTTQLPRCWGQPGQLSVAVPHLHTDKEQQKSGCLMLPCPLKQPGDTFQKKRKHLKFHFLFFFFEYIFKV